MKSREEHILLISILFFALSHGQVFAQEKAEPPTRRAGIPQDTLAAGSDVALPQISLPEFNITGKDSLELLEAFKTRVDEDRYFDVSSQKPEPGDREAYRVDLIEAPKIHSSFQPSGEGYSGKITAGYGSFRTPFVDAWVGTSSRSWDALARGGYKSSNGHVPNADFSQGKGELLGGMYLSESAGFFSAARLQAGGAFDGSTYRFYGSRKPASLRTMNTFGGDISLKSSPISSLMYAVAFRARTASVADSSTTKETSVGVEFAGGQRFKEIELRGNGAFWRDYLDAPLAFNDPLFFRIGLTGKIRIADQLDLKAGGTYYLLRGSDTKRRNMIYPLVGLAWYANRRVMVFAEYAPYAERASVASLIQTNPYVRNDVQVRNPDFFSNLSVGVELQIADRMKSKISMNQKHVREYSIFVDPDTLGVWKAAYLGSTRMISGDAEFVADITEEDHISAKLTLLSTLNSETGKQLPFHPAVRASGQYQHRFPFGLTLSTALTVVDQHYADTSNTRSLPSFFMMDFRAAYAFAPRYTVSLTLDNVFDQRAFSFESYVEPFRRTSLSLSFAW